MEKKLKKEIHDIVFDNYKIDLETIILKNPPKKEL
jgi:hypothetical protein